MKQYISHSQEETKKFAQNLVKNTNARVFALSGNLGAGKTTFVQGFAKGLGVKEKIISPTFVLIRQHPIPATQKILYHIDLYRLDKIDHLGLEEIWSDPNNIVLIEWAEKLKDLPKNATKILIKKQDVNERVITLS